MVTALKMQQDYLNTFYTFKRCDSLEGNKVTLIRSYISLRKPLKSGYHPQMVIYNTGLALAALQQIIQYVP